MRKTNTKWEVCERSARGEGLLVSYFFHVSRCCYGLRAIASLRFATQGFVEYAWKQVGNGEVTSAISET